MRSEEEEGRGGGRAGRKSVDRREEEMLRAISTLMRARIWRWDIGRKRAKVVGFYGLKFYAW